MMTIKKVIIFSNLFYFSFGTSFIHLIGYQILADPLGSAIEDLGEDECATECVGATAPLCIGFEYSALTQSCKLLSTIRNIVTNISACNYYIFDRRDGANIPADLEEIDQLTYSNAYFNASCPQGWSDDATHCSLGISESKCSEYAEFFNATFDGTECYIPLNRTGWYCIPNSIPEYWKYTSEFEGYCYFKTTSVVRDMVTFVQNCHSISANSFPLTVCSEAENDFIQGIITDHTMIGLYLPIGKAERIYEWADGSDCEYRKFQPIEPDSYYTNNTESVTQLKTNGYWRDITLLGLGASTTLYCRENALTLEEYANSCETIDDCAQIN